MGEHGTDKPRLNKRPAHTHLHAHMSCTHTHRRAYTHPWSRASGKGPNDNSNYLPNIQQGLFSACPVRPGYIEWYWTDWFWRTIAASSSRNTRWVHISANYSSASRPPNFSSVLTNWLEEASGCSLQAAALRYKWRTPCVRAVIKLRDLSMYVQVAQMAPELFIG